MSINVCTLSPSGAINSFLINGYRHFWDWINFVSWFFMKHQIKNTSKTLPSPQKSRFPSTDEVKNLISVFIYIYIQKSYRYVQQPTVEECDEKLECFHYSIYLGKTNIQEGASCWDIYLQKCTSWVSCLSCTIESTHCLHRKLRRTNSGDISCLGPSSFTPPHHHHSPLFQSTRTADKFIFVEKLEDATLEPLSSSTDPYLACYDRGLRSSLIQRIRELSCAMKRRQSSSRDRIRDLITYNQKGPLLFQLLFLIIIFNQIAALET